MAQPVLFAGPHQDDELLSLPIRTYVGARAADGTSPAYDVHVLLCTTGENSGARPSTMDKPTFGKARDDEYRRATRRAGVLPENIHVAPYTGMPPFRPADGELTAAFAYGWIASFLDTYPDAWVKTLTNLQLPAGIPQRHSDHVALGQAAVQLLADGLIVPNGLRLYVEPYHRAAFESAYPAVHLGSESSTNYAVTRAALKEYDTKDGVGFKFGFGWTSVSSYFQMVYDNPTHYWHIPILP